MPQTPSNPVELNFWLPFYLDSSRINGNAINYCISIHTGYRLDGFCRFKASVQEMAGRVTIADVAERAGVSVATVDRVLSRRRPVRPATAEVVLAAATELGFYATPLLQRRARELVPSRTLGFVLQKQSKRFYGQLAREIESAAGSLEECNATCVISFVDELSPRKIAEAMRMMVGRVCGVAVVALDHPHVWDEISNLRNVGIPVWALLSGISSPDIAGCLAIDSRKAGRTAAWAMARCARPGSRLGVLVGSHRYTSHEEREGAFRSYFREHVNGFELVQSIAYLDSADGAYEAACELVTHVDGLGGIYLVGGGSSGLLRALKENAVDKSLSVVCHEFTPATREGLIEGLIDMVIATPSHLVAETAVRALAYGTADDSRAGRSVLPFQIHISENI